MAKSWIAETVKLKGHQGRRWLGSLDDSNCEQSNSQFSSDNGALIVHMSDRRYMVQALEVDSKRASTIWVGDGGTKIGAVFTRAPADNKGHWFKIQVFDIVIDPTRKPESRVTLRIRDYDLENATPIAHVSSITYVEHISGVQKLLKNLDQMRKQGGQSSVYGSETTSSPMLSQTGDLGSPLSPDGNFGTQPGSSTQLFPIDIGYNRRLTPRPLLEADQPEKEEMRKAFDSGKEPKKTNYLLEMARKATSANTIHSHKFTANLHTEREVNKHPNQDILPESHELIPRIVPGHLDRDRADRPKAILTQPVESSCSVPILISANSPEIGLQDPECHPDELEILGDSEREDNQHRLVGINPNTRLNTLHTQVAVSTEHEMGEFCLKDDPWEAMRKTQKIYPSFFELPENQIEVWATPGLSESILPKPCALLQKAKALHQVAEQQLDESNQFFASKNGTPLNNSFKNNVNVDGDPHTAERELGRSGLERTNVKSIESQPEEVLGKVANGAAVNATKTKDQEAVSGHAMSQSHDPPVTTEWPRQVSSNFTHSDLEVSQPNEVRSSTSSRRSSTSDEALSWSLSSNEDQPGDQEPDNEDFDEAVSVVPESSIPGSSLAVGKTLDSEGKYKSLGTVQVAQINLMEEEGGEEEEEEMEIAEPSALDQQFISTEDATQYMDTTPSQNNPSTASRESEMVEVERTPHLQRFQSNIASRVRNLNFDMSDFVVPGTAEEEYQQDEIPMFSGMESVENLSSKAGVQSTQWEKQDGHNPSKNQRVTSTVIAYVSSSTQSSEQSSSIEGSESQRQREPSTIPLDFQSETLLSTDLQQVKTENYILDSSHLQRKPTSRSLSPGQLQHNQHRIATVLPLGYTKQTDVDQECSSHRIADADTVAEENNIVQSSAFIPSSPKQTVTEGRLTSIATSEASRARVESTTIKYTPLQTDSMKRTSLQAELSISPPPPKRITSAKNYPAIFTPGTQSPVNLEELKKSYRRDFLRENAATEQPVASSDHLSSKPIQHDLTTDKSGRGKQTSTETLGKAKVAQIQAVVTASSYENDIEGIGGSDPYMASNQALPTSPSPELQTDIYERYRLAYPSFTESLQAFIRACVYIEWLTPQHLKPMLWDDFVHKFCHEYPTYVISSSSPIPAIKWYNNLENFTCEKKVLRRDNLEEVFALDPVETEKARERFRKGVHKRSNPVPESTNQSYQSPTTPAILPSASVVSNDSPGLGLLSRSTIGNRRVLPWTSSPHSGTNDATPISPSKRRRSEEQNNSRSKQRRKLSPAGFKSHPRKDQLGSKSRPRQASPELGSWRANIPKPRSSSGVAQRQDTDHQLGQGGSLSNSRPPPLRVQSPILSSVKLPRTEAPENEPESISRTGSRRSSSVVESVAEIARKWHKDRKRKRTVINLAERQSG